MSPDELERMLGCIAEIMEDRGYSIRAQDLVNQACDELRDDRLAHAGVTK